MDGLIVILLYVGIALSVGLLGAVLYTRSVGSRKRYCCPQCGEQLTVELMKAQHCNLCGAPLRGEMTGGHR